mgnify:CR=1 FL=1
MLTSVRGIYRQGQIEFQEKPENLQDEMQVIITFLSPYTDLQERGLDEKKAQRLREQLASFAEDWNSPEMSIYDDYDSRV